MKIWNTKVVINTDGSIFLSKIFILKKQVFMLEKTILKIKPLKNRMKNKLTLLN